MTWQSRAWVQWSAPAWVSSCPGAAWASPPWPCTPWRTELSTSSPPECPCPSTLCHLDWSPGAGVSWGYHNKIFCRMWDWMRDGNSPENEVNDVRNYFFKTLIFTWSRRWELLAETGFLLLLSKFSLLVWSQRTWLGLLPSVDFLLLLSLDLVTGVVDEVVTPDITAAATNKLFQNILDFSSATKILVKIKFHVSFKVLQ